MIQLKLKLIKKLFRTESNPHIDINNRFKKKNSLTEYHEYF